MVFGLDFSMSDINMPVVIEEPSDATDFMEAISKAIGNLFGKSIGASSLDADKDGLTDSSERIYGTDPKNPDTDGDGHLDGDEVKNGFNPLNKTEGAKLK
jgi:hypothetical protein